MKKNKIMTMLLAVALVLGMTGCGSSRFDGTLHFASTAENYPFVFVAENGFFAQYDGIEMELVKTISSENNYMPAIENMEVSKYWAAIQNDQADAAIGAITASDEGLADAAFSHMYYDATQVLLVPADFTYEGSATLKELRICTVKGYSDEELLSSLGVSFEQVEKGNAAVEKLQNGQCDVLIVDASLAEAYAGKYENLTVIQDGTSFGEEQYVIALKKGNTALMDKINTVIDTMTADGRMAETVMKYADGE